MKLSIKNFGPIKDGEIDLSKKVYVFVGYNNTGKTYISQLMYALSSSSFMIAISNELAGRDLGVKISNNKFKITKTILKKFGIALNEILIEEVIPKTFNISKNHHLLENVEIEIEIPEIEQIKNNEKIEFNSSFQDYDTIRLIKPEKSLEVTFEVSEFPEQILKGLGMDRATFIETEQKSFAHLLLFQLFNLFPEHSFYLPASRVFYPTFYQYIFKTEKERRELTSTNLADIISQGRDSDTEKILQLLKREQRSARSLYTEPVNNLSNKIYDLNGEPEVSRDYADYISVLEKIMGGKLVIRRAEGIANKEFLLEVENGNILDMYLASSSANQLTALYLYFKYWVKEKSNFLIIDEPEENLHPKSQLKLLEILLDFANKNDNRLLLVNHTPLFTEALNNYIMLGTLKETLEEKEYDKVVEKLRIKDIPLKKEDVGIYFFNGNEIREYEIGEYGTLFKDFDREIYKVKNTSEALSSLILQTKTNVSIPT